MTDFPTARRLLRDTPEVPSHGRVVLSHLDRAIRVRALTTEHGETFVVDLPERTALDGYFGFALEDGRVIEIIYAEEQLLEVRGDLARYAWHLGALNLHCQVEDTRLLIQQNADVEALLQQLGAKITSVSEPFSPEPPLALGHHHHAHQSHIRDAMDNAPQSGSSGDPF